MKAKHRKTLIAIFTAPTPRSLAFRDLEALLCALGCTAEEGPGSAVGFSLGGRNAAFHRPHPGKEAKVYQVKLARNFLMSLGVEP